MKQLLLLLLLPSLLCAQANDDKKAYVEQYKYLAIENMHRTGVPASITLAQGLLESGVGKSPLATEANNHFGIKCHKEWTGETYTMDDDAKDECFRKYPSVLDSYLDHAAFLKSRERYAGLFKLDITDYAGWAHGLKAAGYATNPNYAPLLIKQIEELGLSAYDKVTPEQLALLLKNPAGKPGPVAIHTPPTPAAPKVPSDCKEGMFKFNGVKVVCARAGESPLAVAERTGLYPWQILKYNDIENDLRFAEGDKVYLAPKKKSNRQQREHAVGTYESLRDISQMHGVSMAALRRKNQLKAGEELAEGEIALLYNKRADRPKVRTREELQALIMERDRKAAALVKPEAPVKFEKPSPPPTPIPVKQQTGASISTGTGGEVKPKDSVAIPSANPAPVKTEPAKESIPVPVPPKNEEIRQPLKPGTEVVLPTKPAEKPGEAVPTDEETKPAPVGPKKHTVAKGDTMFNIAKRYGISVDKLKSLNNLADNNIKLGMELIVSE